uniref:Uncharacterized protein n=1 Tax=Oryza sativa subsp. japonica TaxID=39947 RepID=Q2QPF8_ORYSJ|nr:hypothetical protein LOC_Os12g34620 [Oryza sativa Japonica Group]
MTQATARLGDQNDNVEQGLLDEAIKEKRPRRKQRPSENRNKVFTRRKGEQSDNAFKKGTAPTGVDVISYSQRPSRAFTQALAPCQPRNQSRHKATQHLRSVQGERRGLSLPSLPPQAAPTPPQLKPRRMRHKSFVHHTLHCYKDFQSADRVNSLPIFTKQNLPTKPASHSLTWGTPRLQS